MRFATLLILTALLPQLLRAQADSISTPVTAPSFSVKKRMQTVALSHAAIYAGSMLALNQAWYSDYERTAFHTFNDWPEWQQVDKAGHTWSAYQLSRASTATWKWAGATPGQQVWLGAASGFTFLTVIEVLDGFSEKWGWSWADFGANVGGSALFATQQALWNEQRVGLKFSFHRMQYPDIELQQRGDELYGNTMLQRMLKDYNGQTYWLSGNLHAFFPQSNIPKWLNLAVGYGADGMFGGTENSWTDANGMVHVRNDMQRTRQIYLSPDIDFTRIPAKRKWVRSVLFCLNAFKMPAPALVYQKGKLRLHGFYF